MGAFLGPVMNVQISLILYHKRTIVPEWVGLSVCSSSWQSFPKPWAIIILSTLLWSLILFSYSLRISKNVSVKKVLEFHSVAYEIQPMFTRSSISFCLLSRLITLGKVNKSNGGPCTYKVFGLEMCKEILFIENYY